jgi:DNA-binding transcriptional regulator/RsmH inhibitor MraZ
VMLWLKRLNFMETAKLEMELMKAFEAGEDLDAKLEAQAQIAGGGDAEEIWRLEVWQKMLLRIRKMQELMKDKPDPNS